MCIRDSEEVERLQGLRGTYGIAAPAPLCTDADDTTAGGQVVCQVLESPESSSDRLVPDSAAGLTGPCRSGLAYRHSSGQGPHREVSS